MGEMNIELKLTISLEEKLKQRNMVFEQTLLACNRYGAFEVRKAALSQMKGDDVNALEKFGLQGYDENEVFNISNKVFFAEGKRATL